MSEERAPEPSRALLRGVVAWSLILALGLGATEVLLRVLDLPFREAWTPTESALARFDEELGWSYRPDHSARHRFGDARRPVPMHFDAIGSRVASRSARLHRELPTILFVGGSFTMGHGVTWAESFVGRVGADPRVDLQVVNLGVQGYGTDQSLLLLERHLEAFDTRAVVYAFICDHVERNATHDRRLVHPGGRFLGTKPRFALDGEGHLVQTHRPRRYEEIRTSRIGASLRVIATRYGPRPGLDLTRALVDRMRDRTEAAGARFLLLYWQGSGAERCGDDPFAGLGIAGIRTAEHAPPDWDSWVIPGDGHPDPRAHRHVADLVVDALERLGVLALSADRAADPAAAPDPARR